MLNAFLFGAGIVVIIVNVALFGSAWPILSVIIFILSAAFPFLSNSCTFKHDMFDQGSQLMGSVSWMVTGLFVILGYGIPFELWRTDKMPLVPMIISFIGGTTILASIFLFAKILEYDKGSSW